MGKFVPNILSEVVGTGKKLLKSEILQLWNTKKAIYTENCQHCQQSFLIFYNLLDFLTL